MRLGRQFAGRARVSERWLVLDCCGDEAVVGVAEDGVVVWETRLGERRASQELIGEVRRGLDVVGWSLQELSGVAVVTGPGSFTGVRVGLAAVKGICEASGIRLRAVSRLEALLEAGGDENAVAVLYAGRGLAYVRVGRAGAEELVTCAEVQGRSHGLAVVVAEPRMLEELGDLRSRLVTVDSAAILAVARRAETTDDDVVSADGNYVRSETQIYAAAQRGEVEVRSDEDRGGPQR